MATVQSVSCYQGGAASSNPTWIGYQWATNFCRTYKFTTGASGATSTTAKIALSGYIGNTGNYFGMVIDQDPNSYKDYNGTAGTAVKLETSPAQLSATIVQNLLPNTVYYLHVFCRVTVSSGELAYAANNVSSLTLTESGSYGGLVRIYDGSAWKQAIPYVYNGTEWKQAMAYTHDGSAWKMNG